MCRLIRRKARVRIPGQASKRNMKVIFLSAISTQQISGKSAALKVACASPTAVIRKDEKWYYVLGRFAGFIRWLSLWIGLLITLLTFSQTYDLTLYIPHVVCVKFSQKLKSVPKIQRRYRTTDFSENFHWNLIYFPRFCQKTEKVAERNIFFHLKCLNWIAN